MQCLSCEARKSLNITTKYIIQGMPAVSSFDVAPPVKILPSLELSDTIEVAREASDFLKALSHETRLLILCFLVEGEQSVSELEDHLSLKQSNVSQHLGRLRLDGLVKTRREGQTVYYSIACDDVHQILGTLHKIFCKRRIDQVQNEDDAS
jgi:DNA-binding transcriptional ArsR family regulator